MLNFQRTTLYTYTLKTENENAKVAWFSDGDELSKNQTFQMKSKSTTYENGEPCFEYTLTANFHFPTIITAIVDGLRVECNSPFEQRILVSYHEDGEMHYKLELQEAEQDQEIMWEYGYTGEAGQVQEISEGRVRKLLIKTPHDEFLSTVKVACKGVVMKNCFASGLECEMIGDDAHFEIIVWFSRNVAKIQFLVRECSVDIILGVKEII